MAKGMETRRLKIEASDSVCHTNYCCEESPIYCTLQLETTPILSLKPKRSPKINRIVELPLAGSDPIHGPETMQEIGQ
jgi:hypothetical protein